MKNVYLIQPNNMLSDSVYLPYSIGSLAAYSFQFEEIRESYQLCDFIFMKDDIDSVAKSLINPTVIGFSCYMWNVEYNLSLAQQIKALWKNCIVVFGGPQIPDDTEYLKNYDFIDILIHGEGEIPFYEILSGLNNGADFSGIKNISFRKNNRIFKTEREFSLNDLDYPSPYTEGYFDYIISDERYAGLQFDAIIETNRGCPYKCIYCAWSDNTIRKFPEKKVYAELAWLAENKIQYCICADSNFGIFDRDKEFAGYIVELKRKYGYPQKFETTAAKNKDELIYKINCELDSVGLNRGISVAVQSMSEEVLKIIGRQNMSSYCLADQLEIYRTSGMYTYTDIILGLPGETFESFCKGVFGVIEAGQHYAININRCEFLPNTPMYSKEYVEKYQIKTIVSHLRQVHSTVSDERSYDSRSELIVETSTMTKKEWRNALRISICTQGFHCLGLLRFFAIYLRKAKKISYYDFYVNLYEWIENKSITVKRIVDDVCQSIDSFLDEKGDLGFFDKQFGNIYWNFEEGLVLSCIYCLDEFYDEIKYYLSSYFDEKTIFYDLLEYQKSVIVRPNLKEREKKFEYDWLDYFNNIFDKSYCNPNKKSTTYNVGAIRETDWFDFGKKYVWYGRRNDLIINKSLFELHCC